MITGIIATLVVLTMAFGLGNILYFSLKKYDMSALTENDILDYIETHKAELTEEKIIMLMQHVGK